MSLVIFGEDQLKQPQNINCMVIWYVLVETGQGAMYLHWSTSLCASSLLLIIGATIPQAPASKARLWISLLKQAWNHFWQLWLACKLAQKCGIGELANLHLKLASLRGGVKSLQTCVEWRCGKLARETRHLISAGVLSATRTIGKQAGNFSRRCRHSKDVRSSRRPAPS